MNSLYHFKTINCSYYEVFLQCQWFTKAQELVIYLTYWANRGLTNNLFEKLKTRGRDRSSVTLQESNAIYNINKMLLKGLTALQKGKKAFKQLWCLRECGGRRSHALFQAQVCQCSPSWVRLPYQPSASWAAILQVLLLCNYTLLLTFSGQTYLVKKITSFYMLYKNITILMLQRVKTEAQLLPLQTTG